MGCPGRSSRASTARSSRSASRSRRTRRHWTFGSGNVTPTTSWSGWTCARWTTSPPAARPCTCDVAWPAKRLSSGSRVSIGRTPRRGRIKRIDIDVTTSFGDLPVAEPWDQDLRVPTGLDTSALQLLPQGLFVQTADETESIASAAGPGLDEYGSWLDVDRDVPTAGPRRFVAQVYRPELDHIGVILPAFSTIHSTAVQRLAPFDDSTDAVRQMALGSAGSVSFVAFAPRDGSAWKPGVYALTVAWDDADGDHEETWHVEVRPGPVTATPVLLAATRAWSRFVGSNGVLLGVPESLSGTDPLGVTLLEITPQTGPGYPGLSGSDLIGCGATIVQGRPEVIGIVGDPERT